MSEQDQQTQQQQPINTTQTESQPAPRQSSGHSDSDVASVRRESHEKGLNEGMQYAVDYLNKQCIETTGMGLEQLLKAQEKSKEPRQEEPVKKDDPKEEAKKEYDRSIDERIDKKMKAREEAEQLSRMKSVCSEGEKEFGEERFKKSATNLFNMSKDKDEGENAVKAILAMSKSKDATKLMIHYGENPSEFKDLLQFRPSAFKNQFIKVMAPKSPISPLNQTRSMASSSNESQEDIHRNFIKQHRGG